MKTKLISAGVMAVSMAGLLSCSDDINGPGGSGRSQTITANIDNGREASRSAIDQRTYIGGELGILWTPTDTIGVFSESQSNSAFINQSTTTVGRTQFKGDLSGTPLYAYYPYSRENDGRDLHSLAGQLPAVQNWSMSTREITGDYKYGSPRGRYPDEFDFKHIFSMLKMTVDVSGTAVSSERLVSVEIQAPGSRQLAGDFTFDVTDGSYSFTGDNVSNSLKLVFDDRPQMNDGYSFTGYLSCAPTLKTGDKVNIVVVTDSHRAVFPATMLLDYEAGKVYNFNIVLKNHADNLTIEEVTVPVMTSFEFEVKNNEGKILSTKVVPENGGKSVTEEAVTTQSLTIDDHRVSGMIPYLYDFNLVATFDVPQGVKAYVGGVEQTSGKSVVDFTKPVEYTLVSADGGEAKYTVSVTNTGLPVMVINQSTATTAPTETFVGGLKLRAKDTGWVEDDMIALYDINGKYTMSEQACGIRLRGNTSQEFPKKPMAIKLKKKAAVGDMPKHKRWVLLANWLDNSMIRNHIAFEIARATEQGWRMGGLDKGLLWNPHGVNVELVVDGRHVGNYYLCEQIKIDGDRVAIKDAYEDLQKDGLSSTYADCGFLIECDDAYDEAYKFKTTTRSLPFMLKDDANTVPDEYFAQIKTKIQGIEDNLKNGNYTAAYENLDINSVIDQWFVFELTMNNEYRHPKSVYMYMDGGESKLCAGPVWDFDWQTFPNSSKISSLNSKYLKGWSKPTPPSMTDWMYGESSLSSLWLSDDQPYMWYPYLFKDANFRKVVQDRWAVIYPYLTDISNEIALMYERNVASWEVNHAMWPEAFTRSSSDKQWCFNGDEDLATYGEVLDNLKNMYEQRLEWMNTAITSGNFVTNAK